MIEKVNCDLVTAPVLSGTQGGVFFRFFGFDINKSAGCVLSKLREWLLFIQSQCIVAGVSREDLQQHTMLWQQLTIRPGNSLSGKRRPPDRLRTSTVLLEGEDAGTWHQSPGAALAITVNFGLKKAFKKNCFYWYMQDSLFLWHFPKSLCFSIWASCGVFPITNHGMYRSSDLMIALWIT